MPTRMTTVSYRVRFLTPAFLGNADQSGQWRTPPFKALLRQWWRVAYAADHGFNVGVVDMRREEGRLFGHAWLEDDRDSEGQKINARRSLVRIRLAMPNGDASKAWDRGTQQGVSPLPTGLDTSYAWFGLIKRGGGLPERTAIKAGGDEGQRTLHIAYPDHLDACMQEVLRLIDAFGLLGSRSRGGWGAFHVDGIETMDPRGMPRYARPIDQCLDHDWAMSLATDEKGLCVWESESTFTAWHDAMRIVASERKAVRTALKAVQGHDLRDALGFAGPGRMPSPLRWKIVPPRESKLTIRVFAMPHALPADRGKFLARQDLLQAWKVVCATLDQGASLARVIRR